MMNCEILELSKYLHQILERPILIRTTNFNFTIT